MDSVASVAVSPSAGTLVAIGDTIRFSATPRNTQGSSVTGKKVTWASSDSAVAEIDSTGITTAVGNGAATILATINGVTDSAALTVDQQAASLRILIKPSGAAAGLAFDIQPVVEIVDRNGHVATNDDTTTVTASLASGEGEIVGRDGVKAQAGVAAFTDLGVRGVVGERQLRFDARGLSEAVSDAFTVAAGPPESLRFRVEPGSAKSGTPLGTQPVLEIRDSNDNIVADDDTTVVTVSIASGGGSIIGGASATAQAGVVTFADLTLGGNAGERTLRFEAEGLSVAVSEAFMLAAGPARSLHIRVEPAGATVGSPLDTQPVIEIRDENGNVIDGDDSTVVTASIASGGGSIGGASVTVEAGVATFTELAIDGDAGERTLRFEAEGLSAAVSKAFTLAAGSASTLHIRVEPAGATLGSPLETQPVIEIRDEDGNVIDGDDSTVVTASIASGGGTIASGASVTVEAGVATFTELTLEGDLGEQTLRFEAEGLTAAVSKAFTLAPGSASALHIRVEPSGAKAGLALDTQPVIEIRDEDGNVITDDDSTVVTASIASGGGSISGAASETVEAGVATFTELALGGKAGDRTVRFRADGLGAAVSKTFALAPGPAASISLHDGDGQRAPADTDLPASFAVIVQDAFDNAVADVAVDWTVKKGTGTFRSDDGPTNANGVTRAGYRLGRHAGVDTVQASAAGLDGTPITFTATATPNARISGTVASTSQLMSAGVLAGGHVSSGAGARAPAAYASMMPATGSLTNAPRLPPGAGGTAGPSGPLPLRQSPSQPDFVPGELIVTFRAQPLSAPPIGASAYRAPAIASAVVTSMRRALEAHERAGRMTVMGVSPAVLTARLRVDPAAISSAEQALRADPAVERVERNPIVYSTATPLPANVAYAPLPLPRLKADARFHVPLGTWDGPAAHAGAARAAAAFAAPVTPNDEFYFWQAWHYHMIDLPRAWRITTGNASVLVAVLDDGVRFDHPDIAPNLTNDGYDFVSEGSVPLCAGGTTSGAADGDGYDADPTTPVKRTWLDTCAGNVENNGGHGLAVAGIIGARSNNRTGVASVNWNVSIRPVRVLDITGRGSHYDVAQGLLYAAGLAADDGAGGTVTAPTAARIINMSVAGPQASQMLEDAVAAATNAGALIIASAGNAGTAAPQYPGAYPQTVSVSAVQPDGSLASYSSFGPTVDIAAPGGETTIGCDFGVMSTTWNFVRGIRSFSCLAGTSMAAPHVAGVAALVLATQPGLSRTQLRARLIDHATPAGDADRYGAGIVNARNSLSPSHPLARLLYARLIDADGGAIVATVRAAPNGSYAFSEIDDGNYYVYAGEDEDGDGLIGVPVRRWGAAGGSPMPTVLTVDGADEHPVSFSIGIPVALEEQTTDVGGNILPIDGYFRGEPGTRDIHEFTVQIPTAGRYVFETSAVSGACGFALEANTRLELYDGRFTLIASHDDIDAAAGNYCARITTTLQPGTYQLQVIGVSGRYAVAARKES